jgi:hypothetical protein
MKSLPCLIFVAILLSSPSCSGDKNTKQPKKSKTKQLAPAIIEVKPTVTNSTNVQDIQPNLHLSGTQNTHISGKNSKSDHLSGQ